MSIGIDQMELGTQAYRCKGCTGEYCRVCSFGDMWERDITQMPYSVKEIIDDCGKYIAEADRKDDPYVDRVNVNFLREIKRILTSDMIEDAISANSVTPYSAAKYKVGDEVFRLKYIIDPRTSRGKTVSVKDTIQRVFIGKTAISYKLKSSKYQVREEYVYGSPNDAQKSIRCAQISKISNIILI